MSIDPLKRYMEPLKRYWIYHKKQSPLGQIVYEKEYKSLLKKGWVKTPNEFDVVDNVARGTEPEPADEVVTSTAPPEE